MNEGPPSTGCSRHETALGATSIGLHFNWILHEKIVNGII